MRNPPRLDLVEAAIVDLDGTMVDTLGDFEAAIGAMLDDLRLPAAETGFLARIIGKGSEHLVRETLRHCAGDPARFDEAWQRYQAHYESFNGRHSQVYAGVVEGLSRFRGRGWRLACVTNKPLRFAEELLALKGLRGSFEQVFGGDSFERKKPDPQPLLETCRALGVAPAATLVIGDSSNDALAARAAGCPVVLVSYGYNHGEPVGSVDCDAVIERLDAL